MSRPDFNVGNFLNDINERFDLDSDQIQDQDQAAANENNNAELADVANTQLGALDQVLDTETNTVAGDGGAGGNGHLAAGRAYRQRRARRPAVGRRIYPAPAPVGRRLHRRRAAAPRASPRRQRQPHQARRSSEPCHAVRHRRPPDVAPTAHSHFTTSTAAAGGASLRLMPSSALPVQAVFGVNGAGL